MPIATNSEKIDISSEVKTAGLAEKFSEILKKGDIVFFYGEIGAGKTTFIRYLIQNLQKKNKIKIEEVTSPTFNIVNEYDIGDFKVQHYDLFRIKNRREIENIGLFENYEEILTLIEWPEKINKTIDHKISLIFEYSADTDQRILNIKGLKKEKLNVIK